MVKRYAEKSTCGYPFKTLECIRHQKTRVCIAVFISKHGVVVASLAYSLVVVLAATINGPGGIEK